MIKEAIFKILLFISAFVPMYVLLLLKFIIEIITNKLSTDFVNIFMVTFLSVLTILGTCAVLILFKNTCTKKQKIKLTQVNNTTDQHFLSYFSLFVLFALTFELEKISMAVVFIVILLFIGIVYIKNNLYHINPFLNILGYSFYNITCEINGKTQNLKVFYNGKLRENFTYLVCDMLSNFTVVKNINKK